MRGELIDLLQCGKKNVRNKIIQIFSKVGYNFRDISFEARNSNTSTSGHAMVNSCQSVSSLKKGSQELENKNRRV